MKLFLIDGHALVFKMYYAFLGRPMVNSRGEDTSILFGFTKYLLELIRREQPTHLAVSFDPPGGTFRNVMYPEYKANRGETPQLVIDALEPLTAIVKAMNIPVLMIPGFEADDVIGSMAKRSATEGFDVYMVTPDKDYGQLVEDHIFQYRPGKSGSDNEVLGPAEVCTKWNISSPAQVIDILALCGDSSDNVPGVQGVGPVGAAKLLAKFGSVRGIYDNIDTLTARQMEMFRAAEDHIDLSYKLVTIKTDISLDTTADDMVLGNIHTQAVEQLFDRYEFPSLKRLLPDAPDPVAPAQKSVPSVPVNDKEIPAESLKGSDRISIVLSGNTLYAACAEGVASGQAGLFRDILENDAVTKIGTDLKSTIEELEQNYGITLAGRLFDVSLVHYLLNPERSHSMDTLALAYLGLDIDSGKKEPVALSLFNEGGEAESGASGALEAAATFALAPILEKELQKTEGLEKLYREIEEPLMRVLAGMEMTGVKIDIASLKDFADSLRLAMAKREREIRDIAGDPELNIASPRQVGNLIFEKLKLDPSAKKSRNGSWPTDEQTLQELSDKSPVIEAILDYRGLRKLLSTYIEPIPSYVSETDGRVHTTFNQMLTSTGRLSSSNPNLQNIPVRTEQGREIRKAFVAGKPGYVMMSADYSQIELRIMAHLCADKHMREAFSAGTDVHSATAAKIFGIPVAEVTPDQRRIAKTANFGIMYGISAFGLAQRLGCTRQEAKRIIEDYFASFPSIRAFIDDTLSFARENGYVETVFGRRRYTPDVAAHNAQVRSFAERNAVNAPIQGTAADIIKLAMIGVDRRLREEGLKARMVLQIHDELLLEVPEEEITRVKEILVKEMEGVVELSVPLTVECNYGKNWLEAH